ncbi:MAG: AMP-dependent synthetase [Candidatus Methylumidiphilus alinenensis]|uniref:AMP-dependent synthetase n=1 Tax=Candidatus Methylumidiphilus alinenensis TaxID=2202197 RepID=A0A2W4TB63_9GAMM|nr:MAG: AMP-dependent synthetase [Candidatus Methylumidiphilus alinenensis]
MQETQNNIRHPIALANEEPFALYEGKLVRHGNLWADVRQLAGRLPDRPYVFNLCENRYLFCLSLLAAASRGQICLLPPSSQMAVVREIIRDYPGAYLASESPPHLPDLEWFAVKAPRSGEIATETGIDWDHATLIAFTSGSSGKPKPCTHSLATFRISADMAVRSLGLCQQQWLMVSTTPPQHMYGLETSVFWPLFSSLVLHDGRPFFPEDIRRAVETAPWPAMLATTPTHLRSLVKANSPWAKLAGVLSATDALSARLAHETDVALGQSPHEIYGSTETLSFASREPLRESLWRPYTNIRLIQDETGQTRLESPHLQAPILLQDCFKLEADGQFAVLGRHSDIIKIGGKRASLAELTRRLKDIAGVEDGFCFVQEGEQGEARLGIVVVSRLDKQGIREGLRPYVDEVFLPRKIHFVECLPRNEVGKLAKAEVEKLLAGLSLRCS